MPLPGSCVIHVRWSEHHRPTATSTMTAECVITRAAAVGTTADDGTWSPPARATVYAGACRIVPSPARTELAAVIGERRIIYRHYEIQIRYDTAEIHTGDVLEVTAAIDAGLVGLTLRIADATYSSEQWSRVLVATEFEAGA